MGKIVTSIKIDEELWQEAKIYAIKNRITFAEVLERGLKSLMESENKVKNKPVARSK